MSKEINGSGLDKSLFEAMKKQPVPPVNRVVEKTAESPLAQEPVIPAVKEVKTETVVPTVEKAADEELVGIHIKLQIRERRRLNKYLATQDHLNKQTFVAELIMKEMDRLKIDY